jgi:hypothetical protein
MTAAEKVLRRAGVLLAVYREMGIAEKSSSKMRNGK